MCLALSARYIRKLAGSIFGLALDTQLSYTNYLKTILNNNLINFIYVILRQLKNKYDTAYRLQEHSELFGRPVDRQPSTDINWFVINHHY